MDIIRADDFIEKADKYLAWIQKFIVEMEGYGSRKEMEDVERVFVAIIYFLDTVRQSLLDAGNKLNEYTWVNALKKDISNDHLLNYLYLARNSEAHNALVKWVPSLIVSELKVVDAEKANKISKLVSFNKLNEVEAMFQYFYEATNNKDLTDKIENGVRPNQTRIDEAGFELITMQNTLAFREFHAGQGRKKVIVDPPKKHFNKDVGGSAYKGVEYAKEFYLNKLSELKGVREKLK